MNFGMNVLKHNTAANEQIIIAFYRGNPYICFRSGGRFRPLIFHHSATIYEFCYEIYSIHVKDIIYCRIRPHFNCRNKCFVLSVIFLINDKYTSPLVFFHYFTTTPTLCCKIRVLFESVDQNKILQHYNIS